MLFTAAYGTTDGSGASGDFVVSGSFLSRDTGTTGTHYHNWLLEDFGESNPHPQDHTAKAL